MSIFPTTTSVLLPEKTAKAESSQRTLFLLESERVEEGAELVSNTIQHSTPGDIVEGMALTGKDIFSLHMDSKADTTQVEQAKMAALDDVQRFLHEQTGNPQRDSVDIANTLKTGIERFNHGKRSKHVSGPGLDTRDAWQLGHASFFWLST